MTQHSLTDDEVLAAFRAAFPVGPHLFTPDASNFARAIIAAYQAKQAKELPVLPEPIAYIASDKYGNFGIALKENIAMRSCEPGEAVIEPLVLLNLVQAYGAACAAHASEVALEEAANICNEICDDPHIVLHVGTVCAENIRVLKKAGK